MYAATPFLIPVIAERYGVSEGAVSAVSVAQVGAFAAANFILPRLLTPSGRILRIAAAVLLLLNIASAIPSIYGVLVGIRLIAGFAAGAMTWLTWTSAMLDQAIGRNWYMSVSMERANNGPGADDQFFSILSYRF